MGYNWQKLKMKKIVLTMTLIAGVVAGAMALSAFSKSDPQNDSNTIVAADRETSDDDWTRVGVLEISKKVGINVPATQKVQVYQNSDGVHAVKDKYGYHEIEDNPTYGRYPADQCFDCGYAKRVFYEGSFWYTHGVVKRY